MFIKARRKIIWASAGNILLLGLGWLAVWDLRVRIASSFTQNDIRAIRREVSRKRWAEVRQAVATRNLNRTWHYALPILFSRACSIAGYPGPPGGACIKCRGLFSDTECSFMVFNGTNGWKCDRISFVDSATMRQIRELQKQYAAEQR